MRKILLKQLYNGELYPAEHINPEDPEFEELQQAINSEEIYFQDLLSDDDCLRFEKLNDLWCQAERVGNFEQFAYGFRLGIGLMIETFVITNQYSEE